MKMFGITKFFNKNFNIEFKSEYINIISFEDPLEINKLHKNLIFELSKTINFSSKEIQIINNFPEHFVPLNLLPTLFVSIIKNYFPKCNVYGFPIEGEYFNVIAEVPITDDSLNYIENFCKNMNLCYVIISNFKINDKYKYLDIKENSIAFKSEDLYKMNHGENLPRIDIRAFKYFFIKHRYISIINRNIDEEFLEYKLRKFKNYFRYRWIHLLIPLYVLNTETIKDITKFIWNSFNNLIKLKIDYHDLIYLGLHPIQLLGSTSLILFRKTYLGSEYAIENLKFKYKNSVVNWIKNKSLDINIYNIIYKNLNYQYNYIGSCPIENLLRQPLLFANIGFLENYNYPYSIGYLNSALKLKYEIKLDVYADNVLNFIARSNNKKKYISNYVKLICH